MLPDTKRRCHCTGFTKSCHKLVTSGACGRWMQLQGQNPQTGEQLSRWGCVDDHVATLLLENAMQQRHTTASVDKLRNETKQGRDTERHALASAVSMLTRGRADGVAAIDVTPSPRPLLDNGRGHLDNAAE
jgi:hypothetical protein